jgi:UrcA family protein
MQTITAMIGAVAVALVAGQANGQQIDRENKAIAVSFADLDLSKADGRAVLEQRVRAAVNVVCPMPELVELQRRRLANVCRADSMQRAQQQLAQIYSHRELAAASIRVAGSAH